LARCFKLNPYLSGVFAPVDNELDVADLPMIGKIPEDLRGVYLRNGPNAKFPPLGSYTYPLDGDGMIHGVRIADGSAHFATAMSRPRASRQ
jgi:carotenoid cleavage dioxygenase-like enzyme